MTTTLLVSRLDEVRSLVVRIGVRKVWLSIITSDSKLNALGKATTNEARVLITTQQGLERKLQYQSFDECSAVYYMGKPRQVRIWDETWLPGEGITLRRYDLADLLKLLLSVSAEMSEAVEELFIDIKKLNDGDTISFPVWVDRFGVNLNDVLRVLSEPGNNNMAQYMEEHRRIATNLFALSGRTVVVRKDGQEGNTTVTFRETLPLDLMPLVVLDASGRVRETYTIMEQRRNNITRLPEAVKRYEPLDVYVWRRGGGKASFKSDQKAKELIEGIVSTIETKPTEPWLIVTHKPSRGLPDIEREISDRLSLRIDRELINFITWGNHASTNAYANVPNIILAGTLFFRPSQYEALGRLAANTPDEAPFSRSQSHRVAQGENAHGILQALCRGAVRQCRGDQCAPCSAYIIASSMSGIPEQVSRIFPGCTIHEWLPVKRRLSGKVKDAVEYLRKRLVSQPDLRLIKFKEVQSAIKMKRSSNFKQDVRDHTDFKAELAEMGFTEWGANKYFTAFRIIDAKLYGFTAHSNN